MNTTANVYGGVPSSGAPRAVASPSGGVTVPDRLTSKLFLIPIIASAFIAIWGGWVGIGQMTGFGVIQLLPGIWDSLRINTSIALPLGVEAYAAYAVRAVVTRGINPRAKEFAKVTAVCAFLVGILGQIGFHLMAQAHITSAPWVVTMLVSCVPVVTLALAVTLLHLLNDDDGTSGKLSQRFDPIPAPVVVPVAPPMPDYSVVRKAAPVAWTPAASSAPEPAAPEVTAPMPHVVPDPVSKTAPPRRSKEETLAAIRRVQRRNPKATQGQIAAEIGCSDRWVREVLRNVAA